MPEKLAHAAPFLGFGPSRRVWVLMALSIVAMFVVWTIDQSTIANLLDVWRYPKEYHAQKFKYLRTKIDRSTIHVPPFIAPDASTQIHDINSTLANSPNVKNGNPVEILQKPIQNLTGEGVQGGVSSGLNLEMLSQNQERQNGNNSGGVSAKFEQEKAANNLTREHELTGLKWVSVELEPNYSSNLLARWLATGGLPCRETRTADIKVEGFDDGKPIDLSTGNAYEIFFQALDESGVPRCLGGDYFEIDLSGESWKSRPPMKDLGNGTYSFTLQVHPDFAGLYNLTIILLFRHFQGLKYSPTRFVVDKELRRIPVKFSPSEAQLPELHACGKSDFDRDLWVGRWTRHAKNDACEISDDGRFRCLEPNHPCSKPWCSGSLGLLESNGWVYSAHCSFKLFNVDDAWKCLNNRWIFLWGDSNHVDTARNILFFFLGIPQLEVVTRRFDKNFINPKNESQHVRITNIFNGHWDMKGNYLGLDSLINPGYRDLLKSYFNGSTVPDTVIFNSGLHDGVYWHSIRRFVAGAERAASFWAEVMEPVKRNGLQMPNFIFRSTVATGGYARTLAYNPSKMEAFNWVLLEKLRANGVVGKVVDDFDMTWPWHFDNRCNDGVHYGRFPAKLVWRDGKMGHQYFVDLMLGHVLLNVICAR
ncbi:hypothetical protein Ancab_030440 [Ancistrocladus abbreviatus]